ncbi:MAG: phenylalanine--tRNA ligase beta subunit-related protein [Candidatus Bathyarchaeota archaeon]|nr:phenylalanine--tRNA ligase beta subunit-related protein [Candidatus Bathyarchaeota archaeon]
MPAHLVTIDPKVTERVPTLYIEHREVSGVKVDRTPIELVEAKKKFLIEWKDKTPSDLNSNEQFNAYRRIHTQFDAYPDNVPPAVENLYLRGILQGKFPTISNVVDACNLVSVRTLVPIGVFDSDLVVGDVTLRLAEAGDAFIPIGKTKPVNIDLNTPILEDAERIISCIGVRDSNETKITKHTENLLIFSWGNKEIPREKINETLQEAEKLIKQYGQHLPRNI